MHVSKAASFASLPRAEQSSILNGLTEAELSALEYDWRFWARPDQLAPAGDWETWLLLAGRGYGKTRTGCEWVRETKETVGRIALVGPTSADVRDVIVNGESGLIETAPPWDRPEYEPSKRRVTWPNGAMAFCYSAEEPERLRGPQHGAAYCDELCLVAGTLIATAAGPLPIETVRAGDLVHTRAGLRRVSRAWRTSPAATVYEIATTTGAWLAGTAGHPVYVAGEGFRPLASLRPGAILCPWEMSLSQALCGAASDGGSTAATTAIGAGVCFTAPSTPPRMARSLLGMTCITRTRTRPTSRLTTWWRSLARIISSCIARAGGVLRPRNNAPPMPARLGPQRSRTLAGAANAAPSSPPPARALASAPGLVGPRIAERTLRNAAPCLAPGAEPGSWPTSLTCASVHSAVRPMPSAEPSANAPRAADPSKRPILEPSAAPALAAMPCVPVVLEVRRLPDPAAVYNIEVEGEHEYFANGLLTHNCSWRYPETWDQLQFGLRLGSHPRVVVTTTPKPIKLLRELLEDATTAVTRGNTAANTANLAPSFLRKVVRKYEGTRLGRQELNAELLDDVPGSLWKRADIDAARVKAAPADMKRIVVAIDPATTSGEDSDETGIVVAGLGHDGFGYVLADLTCRETPQGWARIAVEAYKRHHADRIVAETNQGGEMVEHTIRTVHPHASYSRVHAKRGKVLRAEPVSALYEQHRVRHVGSLAMLEDQLCGFTADFDPKKAGYSPDRVDALVYALSEVMLGAEVRPARAARVNHMAR